MPVALKVPLLAPLAAPDYLSDDELSRRLSAAVGNALALQRVTVTTTERESLVQTLALQTLATHGERHPNTGRVWVRDGAASVTRLTYYARHIVGRDREWHDVADVRSVRERASGADTRQIAVDPQTLDATDTPADLTSLAAALVRANVERVQRDPSAAVEPGALLAHLDTLTDALADWTTGERRRVRLALAVALDERDPSVSIPEHGAGMSLRSAVERQREGARLIRSRVTTDALGDALAAVAALEPLDEPTRADTLPMRLAHGSPCDVLVYVRAVERVRDGWRAWPIHWAPFLRDTPTPAAAAPMPASALAASRAIDTVAHSVGGRTGAKSHAASMAPRERTSVEPSPVAWTGAGTRAASILRYVAAVERSMDERTARDARVQRLAARPGAHSKRLARTSPVVTLA